MRGPRAAVSVIRDVPLELRELSGVGQQGLAHTLSGGIFHGGLGDATTGPESVPPAVDSPVLAALNKRTDEIIARMDAQDKNRKLALMKLICSSGRWKMVMIISSTVRRYLLLPYTNPIIYIPRSEPKMSYPSIEG
jgi:hypothetical protein